MSVKHIVGLDCGNSSFRTLLGRFDGKTITTEVTQQLPNDMVHIGDYFYWDLLRIFDGFKLSLKKIIKDGIKIDSIGVCTWGIDFALMDKSGIMLSNPLAYRNEQGADYLSKMSDKQKKQAFNMTGIACDKINSVYLMQAIKDRMPAPFSIADKLLMVPDILNYFLTGVKINEPSELSTTQLMSSKTRKIEKDICEFFDIPINLFCEIGKHGQIIGNLSQSIKDELEIDYDIPVVCVPSHDTASAVAAIPTIEDKFVFISSGTWSLIGTECDEPIINEKVFKSGLTNEVGAFDKITLLKNSSGMFIIQRLKKEYDWITGKDNSWEQINLLADQYTQSTPLFNINNVRFFNPKNMSKEIWAYLKETYQVEGELNFGAVIKATQHSMAACYAETIEEIEKITETKYDSIYIVGGGSKNIIVNKLTSAYTGKKVVACSKESTALGNIATQLKVFDNDLTLKKIRKIVADSSEIKIYEEKQTVKGIVQKYKNLL